MMSFKYTLSVGLVCTLFILCTVTQVHAAQVTFKVVSNIVQNDTATIVEAYLDPEGSSLNAIEGVIALSGTGVEYISSVNIETGGSAFSLWPQDPVYSKDDKVIRFTGGSTEGVVEEGLLFRMRLFSQEQGDITLSWIGGSAYVSDGQGTPEGISSRSLSIALAQSEPNQISKSSPDSKPPYFEALEVSRDTDVYEGKYFISFHANDDISGVARYEVVEGQITTEVSNGIYVLQDQGRTSKVVVIAYDHAGNSASVKVPTKYGLFFEAFIAGALLLLILTLLLWRKMRR